MTCSTGPSGAGQAIASVDVTLNMDGARSPPRTCWAPAAGRRKVDRRAWCASARSARATAPLGVEPLAERPRPATCSAKWSTRRAGGSSRSSASRAPSGGCTWRGGQQAHELAAAGAGACARCGRRRRVARPRRRSCRAEPEGIRNGRACCRRIEQRACCRRTRFRQHPRGNKTQVAGTSPVLLGVAVFLPQPCWEHASG